MSFGSGNLVCLMFFGLSPWLCARGTMGAGNGTRASGKRAAPSPSPHPRSSHCHKVIVALTPLLGCILALCPGPLSGALSESVTLVFVLESHIAVSVEGLSLLRFPERPWECFSTSTGG